MQMETKKTEVIILISDKIDFKPKTVIRDKEGHFIMIKRSIHLEDLTVVNIYAPNIRILLNHREQILTNQEGEIDSNKIKVEDFYTALENSMRFLKKFKMELPYDPAILLLRIPPWKRNYCLRDICILMFIVLLFTIANSCMKTT